MKINPDTQVSLSLPLVETTLASYGVGLLECSEVPEGISNTVVQVKDHADNDYFLKFYKTTHDREIVVQEVEFAGRVALTGLPVPEYIPPLTSERVNYVSSVNGEHATTLTRAFQGGHPETYNPELLHDLGRTHGRLHVYSLQYGQRPGFNPVGNYNFYRPQESEQRFKIIDDTSREILEELGVLWDALPGGLVPMDIKRNNVITRDDTLVGVIDFADINYAPLAFCLAGTLWDIFEASDGNKADLEAYIHSYEQSRELTELEKRALYDIIVLRGWIALHGTMLTTPDSSVAGKQLQLIESLLE